MNNILSKRKGHFSTVIIILLLAAFQLSLYAGEIQKSEKGLNSKHIVPEREIRASAVAYSAERNARVDKVARLLDSEAAQNQLAQWGIKAEHVKSAISRLDNAELEYLAAQADNVMSDLQGGKLKGWMVIAGAFLLPFLVAGIILLTGAGK
jgi:hypothetical protein